MVLLYFKVDFELTEETTLLSIEIFSSITNLAGPGYELLTGGGQFGVLCITENYVYDTNLVYSKLFLRISIPNKKYIYKDGS